MAAEATAPVRGVPRFHGGAVGYLGYETARHFERLPLAQGAAPPMPESAFLRAEDLAVFDHVTRRLKLLTIHRPDREDYEAAVGRIDEMESRLASDQLPAPRRGVDRASWKSNMSPGQFHAMVDAAKEHILGGDAFQIVVSQRFHKPLAASPFDVYRCLRAINPSPYMFFLALGGDRHVVGTSPEKLVQVEGKRVETRPLAGTRRRGADAAEDAALEKELLNDMKERAEHVKVDRLQVVPELLRRNMPSSNGQGYEVPGGAGAGTGGGVIRGLDAAWIGVLVASATGVAEAVGPASPHAVRAMHKPSAAAVRTGQWYCRAP